MFPNLGPMEMLVVGVVAVLLFGKRLPEVGRSLGKGIVEFKKGLRGIEEELESASRTPAPRHTDSYAPADPVDTAVPKFEPPTSAPVARGESS
ncbi:MAG TPA: twin-arginine translocase TatA/TatE family subunit [Isosphaeraceae bacterium]|jgi:sec-independent protein translocase protein TatA|nr:twin-arginine translocase TatA/TatE family subunit [Isosphaeraceae bacterium]